MPEEVAQPSYEGVDVADVRERDEIVPINLRQFEAVCRAFDREGFLFVVLDGGLNQLSEKLVIV